MLTRELIALPIAEIHLWLAYYDEINDEQLHNGYRQMLNDAERMQEPRFYFARDRRRYLVTRAMVRAVLSRYAQKQPKDWTFATNAYGRPEIDQIDISDQRLSFNISHTHSLIVLGITRGCALGVDVENVQERESSLSIADHYFAQSEVAALAALPQNQQQYRFFEYWTFKESYIKARGMGLSLPLDRFGFYFPDERTVGIDIHAELADEPSRWQFWQFQPTSEYLVAVCAEHNGVQRPRLVIRKTVPMRSEEVLIMDPSRISQ